MNNLLQKMNFMVHYTLQRLRCYILTKLFHLLLHYYEQELHSYKQGYTCHLTFGVSCSNIRELLKALTIILWCKNRIPFMFSSVMGYKNDCCHVYWRLKWGKIWRNNSSIQGETKVWLAWRHSTEDVYVKINCWLIDYWYNYLSIV